MTSKEKLKRVARVMGVIALLMLALWFVLFRWSFIPYTGASGSFICYSPNHEYYIKRYQSPFESLQQMDFGEGTAILYDNTGKELYRGHTLLSGGPSWSENGLGKSSVFFQGIDDNWYVDGLSLLPYDRSGGRRSCYDQPVGTITAQQKSE